MEENLDLNNITETQLLNMKLHEAVQLNQFYGTLEILRVVGGWKYTTILYDDTITSIFVPEKNN